MNNIRSFVYLRNDGYIERIDSYNTTLILNNPLTESNTSTTKEYNVEKLIRYSIWDDYNTNGDLIDIRVERRNTYANYHVKDYSKYIKVFKGNRMQFETTDSFDNWRQHFLINRGYIELIPPNWNSFISKQLFITYVRNIKSVPPFQLKLTQIFNNVINELTNE